MSNTYPPEDWTSISFGNDHKIIIPNDSIVENHSLVNLISIIGLVVQYWEIDNPSTEHSRNITKKDIPSIRESIRKDSHYSVILDLCRPLQKSLKIFFVDAKIQGIEEGPLSQLRDLQFLLEMQISELDNILKHPDSWMKVQFSDIVVRLKYFFQAMERNAKGRYRIVFNDATHNQTPAPTTYSIRLNCNNSDSFDQSLLIPTSFVSTIQDLMANARKYSPIGTMIDANIEEKDGIFTFTILDQGKGIPENELSKVVEFGYRASNVKDIESFGGGYGLTKTLQLCSKYDGTMRLSSKLNEGTSIQLEIPIPKEFCTQ